MELSLAQIIDGINHQLQSGQFAAAIDRVAFLKKQFPGHAWSYFAQAYLAESQGDYAVACDHYQECVSRSPALWEAWLRLGHCQWARQRVIASVDALEQALAIAPGRFQLWQALLPRLIQMGESAFCQQILDALLGPYGSHLSRSFAPEDVQAFHNWFPVLQSWQHHLPFCSAQVSSATYFDWLQRQCQHFFEAQIQSTWSHSHLRRDPNRPLKVALLSNEWGHPSMQHVYQGLFKHSQEDIIYSAWIDNPEGSAIRCKGIRSHHESFHWENAALGLEWQKAQIDIVFDLSGWFNPRRLILLAQQPVPLVCAGGSNPPFISHVPGLSWTLSDAFIWPGSTQESAVLLDCFVRWQPPTADPPQRREHSPQDLRLGSASSLNKVNTETLQLWAQLLRTLPQAKFHFKNSFFSDPEMRQCWRQRWQDSGGNPQQLVLIDNQQEQALIPFFADLDLVLEAHPYSGALSTCDALWAGTPVLGLAGGRRIFESICHQLHLPELLAADTHDYIQKGRELAQDARRLGAYHRSLSQRLVSSVICDHPRAIGTIEKAFRQSWRNFCQHST